MLEIFDTRLILRMREKGIFTVDFTRTLERQVALWRRSDAATRLLPSLNTLKDTAIGVQEWSLSDADDAVVNEVTISGSMHASRLLSDSPVVCITVGQIWM